MVLTIWNRRTGEHLSYSIPDVPLGPVQDEGRSISACHFMRKCHKTISKETQSLLSF